MGDFDPAFVHALAVQSWSLYGVGMFLILLRMSANTPFIIKRTISDRVDEYFRYARIHRLGFKGLQADDYIMTVAGVSLMSPFGPH